MTRMRVELPVVIALGSNQASGDHGGREELLRLAVRAIDSLDGVRVTAASGIVETPALKPHGVDETAPSYLNAIVLARVALSPEMLLGALHGIEAALGRVREEVWGDRTIDLDIVDFGGLRRTNETIALPHPRAHERAFVLAPWLQVQPDAVLPIAGAAGSASGDSDSAAAGSGAAGSARVADLLASTTDRVTAYPAEPLFVPGDADADAHPDAVSADPATVQR